MWCWCASTLKQLSWRRCLGGLKTGPPRRHRIQPVEGPVLDPRAKETYFKKGSKSGPPWNQKWSPLKGPVLVPFWHLHCHKFLEAFILNWSWFDQQQLRLESWTGEVHLCAPTFSYVLRTKTGTLFVTLFCFNFHSLEALKARGLPRALWTLLGRPFRSRSKLFCRWFCSLFGQAGCISVARCCLNPSSGGLIVCWKKVPSAFCSVRWLLEVVLVVAEFAGFRAGGRLPFGWLYWILYCPCWPPLPF